MGFELTEFVKKAIGAALDTQQTSSLAGVPIGYIWNYTKDAIHNVKNVGKQYIFWNQCAKVQLPDPGVQGDCCMATPDVPGCTDQTIQDCVGAQDSFCIDVAWDLTCVEGVSGFGCGTCPG